MAPKSSALPQRRSGMRGITASRKRCQLKVRSVLEVSFPVMVQHSEKPRRPIQLVACYGLKGLVRYYPQRFVTPIPTERRRYCRVWPLLPLR